MFHTVITLFILLPCFGVTARLISSDSKPATDIVRSGRGSGSVTTATTESTVVKEQEQSNLVTSDHEQESTNFFEDVEAPYSSRSVESSPEYGSFFDGFPSLPYFPDFGEIFRIQRTTTPQPPFHFPDYVREAFPDPPPESSSSGRRDQQGATRRPSRRPPRPASSGAKPKTVKQNQNEPKQKNKVVKNKPNKARDYPKIFKFTSDRVNLADFDVRKKISNNYLSLTKGDELDPEKVERNKFLILHGGVFEIDRSMTLGQVYEANSDTVTAVTPPEDYTLRSDLREDTSDPPEGFSYY